MEDLRRAQAERQVDGRTRVYVAPKVLIIDEFGVWPYGRTAATALSSLLRAMSTSATPRARAPARPAKAPVQGPTGEHSPLPCWVHRPIALAK